MDSAIGHCARRLTPNNTDGADDHNNGDYGAPRYLDGSGAVPGRTCSTVDFCSRIGVAGARVLSARVRELGSKGKVDGGCGSHRGS